MLESDAMKVFARLLLIWIVAGALSWAWRLNQINTPVDIGTLLGPEKTSATLQELGRALLHRPAAEAHRPVSSTDEVQRQLAASIDPHWHAYLHVMAALDVTGKRSYPLGKGRFALVLKSSRAISFVMGGKCARESVTEAALRCDLSEWGKLDIQGSGDLWRRWIPFQANSFEVLIAQWQD
ncbi:MAG: hypothetical protein ABSD20_01120 [Terriglobales bacterium]